LVDSNWLAKFALNNRLNKFEVSDSNFSDKENAKTVCKGRSPSKKNHSSLSDSAGSDSKNVFVCDSDISDSDTDFQIDEARKD